jgi:hypothetical protein
MGMSADAHLFYGYHLPEGVEMPDEATDLYGDEHPVLVGHYGSGDYPVYYVYVQESRTVVWWDAPKAINPDQLREMDGVGGPKWNGQLLDFAEKYALPNPGEEIGEYLGSASKMGWWLASYYG